VILEKSISNEIKIYHLANNFIVAKTVSLDGKKINFALTAYSAKDSFLILACTLDNQ